MEFGRPLAKWPLLAIPPNLTIKLPVEDAFPGEGPEAAPATAQSLQRPGDPHPPQRLTKPEPS